MTSLMIQGTTSDAGKTTLVAALCRILKREGLNVAPFKPQNMALNSAVTIDGGEIGRAQALQAQACKLEPHTDMNPMLIKPSSDIGAQIIVHGKSIGNMDAKGFHHYKATAKEAVLASYCRLSQQYDEVIIEGAGSPAEINLREGDIANMGFAEAVDCPVVIIADIDKGGVFAHLVGTLALLSDTEQARVKGFVINKFRGDIALLKPGLDWLEERTGKPVLGVLPYLQNFYLDAEDAINAQQILEDKKKSLSVLVPVLPRISNHTDFDSLRLHPHVDLKYVAVSETPPPCDLVVLPGSKNVRSDLVALKENGWEAYLNKHLRYGGKILGICGGFQMLGNDVIDEHGIEGKPGKSRGFGLLDISTTLLPDKTLVRKNGTLKLENKSVVVSGYEIHHGETRVSPSLSPLIHYSGNDTSGVLNQDNNISGTYMHGIFDGADACELLLAWAGLRNEQSIDLNSFREEQLERLADSAASHLNMHAIKNIMRNEKS